MTLTALPRVHDPSACTSCAHSAPACTLCVLKDGARRERHFGLFPTRPTSLRVLRAAEETLEALSYALRWHHRAPRMGAVDAPPPYSGMVPIEIDRLRQTLRAAVTLLRVK